MSIGTSNISISSIRNEIGKGTTNNFNLNTAEDGGYATINICSPSKPSAANPVSFGEWANYDHNAACVAYEYGATICDTSAETCNSTFSSSEASQAITIQPYTGVSRNYDGVNETWMIKNINRFPNATINFVEPELSNIVYTTTGANFPSGGWDLICNNGNYNTISLFDGVYGCFINYNDGSGRTANTTVYVINTYGEQMNFTGSGTGYLISTPLSNCSDNNPLPYKLVIEWPIVVGTTTVTIYQDTSLPNPNPPYVGYFRRRFTNKLYQTDANGKVISVTTC